MKQTALTVASLVGLLLPQVVAAQGTLYVSNLRQTPTGSAAIASDSWVAQTFVTGTNSAGYLLNSVQLLMDTPSGTPSDFSVSIYSKTGDPHSFHLPGDLPQSRVGTLTGSAPATSGIFSYTAAGIALSPSTFYFLMATATTPAPTGSYTWSAASSFTQANGFTIDDSYFASTDGSGWTPHIRQNVYQFAIYATAVPAPTLLKISAIGNGNCQIIAPGNSPAGVPVYCVLESTTNLVSWTSLQTNIFPIYGGGTGVTNIVQMTNTPTFYRVRIHEGYPP
jgi:hypothetical protein